MVLAWVAGLIVGLSIWTGWITLWILAVLLTAVSAFYYRFVLRPEETGEY